MQEKESIEIIELIVSYLDGQLDDDRMNTLKTWIHANKANQKFFDDMRELWLASTVSHVRKPFNKDVAYRLFLSRTSGKKIPLHSHKKNPPFSTWFLRIAAALVIGFIIGAGLFWPNANEEKCGNIPVAHYETIVPFGSISRLVLADGTRVWLNAGSKFRYSTDFGQKNREVYLEGEGYFDIAKDTTMAFIVKTDKIDVKALGTSFNVKAYPGEANIETILVEGKVTIDDKIILAPNEKCIYSRKNEQLIIEKKDTHHKEIELVEETGKEAQVILNTTRIIETSTDPVIQTSWKDDLWRIERETLSSLAVKLERKYNVKIHFADNQSKAMSINATLKDESIEQVLSFLQLSVPIDFKIKGKDITLKEDKYLREKYKHYYIQK